MHPIVLAHGFFGFKELAGIEYFRGVEKYLQRKFPDLKILIPEVAPNDFIEQRAKQLWDHVKVPNEQVHLIGHSMGGLDARFMISPNGLNKAEHVISLTTISTPHWGSPVADFIIDKTEKFNVADIAKFKEKLPIIDKTAKKIITELETRGEVWQYLIELFSLTTKGIKNLTTSYLKEFNQFCTDAPNVKYFSYAGVTGHGEKNYIPPIAYISSAIIYLNKNEKAGGRNDGLVSVNSAKWGEFKGEIPADHFKQVGHDLTGLTIFQKVFPCLRTFNHLKFFEQIVIDL